MGPPLVGNRVTLEAPFANGLGGSPVPYSEILKYPTLKARLRLVLCLRESDSAWNAVQPYFSSCLFAVSARPREWELPMMAGCQF